VQDIGDSGAWIDLPVVDVMRFRPFGFSADGSRVVYATTDGRVAAIDVATGARRVLASCPDDACLFALSPDETRLAFAASDGLEVRDLAHGSTVTVATGRGSTAFPAWSADGRRIAFITTDGIYVTASDGSDLRRIFRFGQLRRAYGPLSWAPDSHAIAFMRADGPLRGADKVFTVATVNADGTGSRQLQTAGTCRCHEGGRLGPPTLVWSPDGRLIAFTTVLPGLDEPGNVRSGPTYVVRPDGTGLTEVGSSGIYLAWQPVRRR
jgi:Tol biopolymer transport system component